MDAPQSIDYASKLWPIIAGVAGGLVGWLLGYDRMRRDVADIKSDVNGDRGDWSVPEMRRQLAAAWVEIERLKSKAEALALADANAGGELKALESRVAEHAKRTIENGQKGYQALFDETLARMETVLVKGAKGA